MITTFTTTEIARLRLQALGLAGPPVASDPTGVVAHHLAMQAQDFPASRWAVGSRLPGSTEAAVLAAYDAGAIVRSWPMRGTVHVVAAPDLPWMLEHLSPRALTGVKRRWDYLGIDQPFLERARDVAEELLRGGRAGTGDGRRLGHHLRHR
ncbi:MAG: crosslink repair DNA glycosylase YcaQ family protein [Gemmatimonadota bacterium]|nr:crosslink repair DNA glycosylase YcaQ family protein [Gemmatimonadota bacterium]